MESISDKSLRFARFLACLFVLFVLFLLFCNPLYSAIVINEVCYDPNGGDEGYEWIELYNNGSINEQLEDSQILSAGQNWVVQYKLPAFVLRPGRFLLIGGTMVPNAQLNCNFTFQNGGSETDGIRFQSNDGSYTDTVLYDEPNSFLLTDDSSSAGTNFAPDVSGGYSLARAFDGVDTNSSFADFIAEPNPTPGLPNRLHCDYALLHISHNFTGDNVDISLWIKNLSLFSPNLTADFGILQNDLLLYEAGIEPIAAGDSLMISVSLPCSDAPLVVSLVLPDDPDSTNNSAVITLTGHTDGNLLINEFLADPDSGNQEWIELQYLNTEEKADAGYPKDYSIRDASGAKIRFSLTSSQDYYVLCQTPETLQSRYPDCPAECVVAATSWTNLNNNGDSLVLLEDEVVLDSLSYYEDEISKGISRERQVDEDNVAMWQNSYSSQGGTPGLPNSTAPMLELPELGKIRLSGSPCKAVAGETISLTYLLPAASNRISCKVFDLRGTKIRTLADYTLCTDRGILLWDGKKQNGSFASRGLYYILWESQAASGGKIMRKQLTAVISN